MSENHTPVQVHVPMAQEYEAVTTLLWVFGTGTKPVNKQEVIQSLDSKNLIFWHLKRCVLKKIVLTSHDLR